MTDIDFYLNVDEIAKVIPKLSDKVMRRQRKALILTGDNEIDRKLSLLIWCRSETSFIPVGHGPDSSRHSAIHFGAPEDVKHHDILINLLGTIPKNFSSFSRVIEIVQNNESEKLKARQKFAWYRDRGYKIRTIKL